MSRVQKDAIKRLCGNEETMGLALSFFRIASLSTGPGTGYDLRDAVSGLPAVCAYLASEGSSNGDVPEKVAQTASCLAPKVWRATVKTVRAALDAVAAREQEQGDAPLEYQDLISQNKLRRPAFVAACMNDVEKSLLKTGQLPEELHPPSESLKVSVFVWVLQSLFKMSSVTPEKTLKRYDVSRRDYEDIVEILEESCQDAADRVRRKVAELRATHVAGVTASTVPATQESAPSTRTPSLSPSRSALATDSERELSLSPHKTPSKSALRTDSEREASLSPHKTPTHKRKVAFAQLGDVDTELLDTPSKRPRLASPAKPTRSQPVSPAKPTQTESSTPAEPVQPPLTQLPTAVPNPSAISPSKPSRPSGGGPPPLPALTMPKPSIFPSAKSASAQSPLDLLAQRSSSRSPWNSSSPTRPQTRSQTQPQPTPKPAPPAPVAGPSTPSRRGRPPKAAEGMPMTPARTTPGRATPAHTSPGRSPARRRVSAALAAFDEDEDGGRSRRFRPVFLDQKQWFQRDPRAEREWRMVEARMRENGMGPLMLGRAGRRPVSA
ncbi:uncharacterized protein B0H18DRAFT_973503 [Fomitopsis serialis]|uniref:uncharacterized protein n=1 Tax=Fomitopsis serialis TaxID=139415 RepID=UPI002008535E|nr:uncharacterized protein B0H18DRAFT_973503 [Neoantrodia serialis]KAH9936350.1 hypothetical protein B0H18DRAFT_973503 [Neoantrodia serialis]